ncbi:MAG: glycerophosphoryl diester phosphodiesterase membrane domain-containing protein [Chloroflexota bacterium]|nr:glycerophosphoryl diester phosphodiesterase membrane domain-containing protein [Chloroflexota bacterium]
MTDQPRAEASGPSATRRDRPLPLRQMGIGELIDAAVRLYRLEWKVLMAIVAFVVVPVTFLEVWASQLLIGNIGPAIPSADPFGELLVLTLVFVAVQFLIVQPFLVAAIARAAADVYLGEQVTIGGTYSYALSRLPAILWITILTTLATLLGFVLLIIPGIIALVRLAFAPAALVVEGHRGSTAVRRSWRLTKGFFWRTLGTLLLSGVIVAIVTGIISLPGELLVQAMGPDAWPLSALVTVLATVLVTPFATLVVVLLYFDLRIRKEGFDIEMMARELVSTR